MPCHDSCCYPEPWPDFLVLARRSIKHARTPHQCVTCRRIIPVGAPCQRTSVLIDGQFHADYQHHPYDPACTGNEE